MSYLSGIFNNNNSNILGNESLHKANEGSSTESSQFIDFLYKNNVKVPDV